MITTIHSDSPRPPADVYEILRRIPKRIRICSAELRARKGGGSSLRNCLVVAGYGSGLWQLVRWDGYIHGNKAINYTTLNHLKSPK